LLGGLYTDWYPRESKEGGAWMDTLFTGNRDAKAPNQPHLAVICGNLTPPLHGQPALLTHHEVETIFHEFGHALHHIFGKVPIKSLNGTNVAWDFVELPSQIFENWCWEKESLDLFAKHYQTQKPIPPDLLQKLLATRNYMEGMSFMGQLARAKIDLELYMHFYNKLTINNLDETVRSILDNYLAKWKTIAPFTICQFSHIFSGGYAAGYYSYKWAEVLDADVFLNQFKAKGIFNATVGQAFKKGILEKGDSEPADKLFRDFMGRDPDPTALLRRSQLISEPAK
jgi:oligopeptidase A